MEDDRSIKSFGILMLIAIAVFVTPLFLWHLASDDPIESLPAPDLTGHLSLSDALGIDVIQNGFREEQIDVTDISQLMWSMQGITSPAGLRTAPSAGGTYPLKVMVLANDVTSLERGSYLYEPATHSLTEVSVNESLALRDCVPPAHREGIDAASAVFIILAEYARTTQKYGLRGIQYVHLEIGHVLQNALLQMASLSLRTQPVLFFDEATVQRMLNTTYSPLLVLPVGPSGTTGPATSPLTNLDDMTVEQAINNRRSLRNYANSSLGQSELNHILGNCSLVHLLDGDDSRFDLRLVLRDVMGLEGGLYDFDLDNGTLSMLNDEDLVDVLFEAGLTQPWIRDAQANLVMSADHEWAQTQVDSDSRWRAMLYSVGMLGQIVYLECTSLGLGTVSIGGLYENQVAEVVETSEGFTSLYIMPIGVL
ncbi:SagB/ThcOx family dehydrogenase [Candidatus Thorarchaeota archaeon]|nr:MAG: SagB/ThcOx family dehydrogenase [Candidatus Thorarchaeota archaeon]